MIACDRCEDWFHGDCIGMDKYTGENLVQRYICPNCTDGKLYVTRYKKTCALERCDKPARMYGDVAREEASIFCSEEHCQLWWEQLVGTLPRSRNGGLYGDVLTQEEFMGLLGTGKKGGRKEGWKIGDEPFGEFTPLFTLLQHILTGPGVPPNFWDITPPSQVLTEEESTLLANSVSDRHSLGEEIVLCKKMLQLIEMAIKQRETLISASLGGPKSQLLGKDFCGYDYRLDTVGATAAFAAFVKSPAGEVIFRTGRLPLPGDEGFVAPDGEDGGGYVNGNGVNGNGTGVAALGSVVCARRKCKPHAGWSGIHTKNVKHQIKELAAQAKEKLDFEARIRDCAAVRYQRRKREKNRVEVVDREVEMEG
jgi:COMPASS component SPP1